MSRSKAQLTQAKRAREAARLEKRVRKQEKKEARKLAASDTTVDSGSTADAESSTRPEGSDAQLLPQSPE